MFLIPTLEKMWKFRNGPREGAPKRVLTVLVQDQNSAVFRAWNRQKRSRLPGFQEILRSNYLGSSNQDSELPFWRNEPCRKRQDRVELLHRPECDEVVTPLFRLRQLFNSNVLYLAIKIQGSKDFFQEHCFSLLRLDQREGDLRSNDLDRDTRKTSARADVGQLEGSGGYAFCGQEEGFTEVADGDLRWITDRGEVHPGIPAEQNV